MSVRTHLGGTIFAEHIAGQGPPVLALHGWGRNRSDLLRTLDGRTVLAPDFPGFGSSPSPSRAWGIGDYADAVADLCREVGGGPYVILAHSFGGRVAAHLAVAHPEHVSAILFSGAPLIRQGAGSSKPSPLYRAVRFATRRGMFSSKHFERMRERRGSSDYRNASGIMRDVLVRAVNDDCSALLPDVACPVGFCYGSLDTAAPPEVAFAAAKLVPDCRIIDIVDGAGHDVHYDAPDRIIDALRAVGAE